MTSMRCRAAAAGDKGFTLVEVVVAMVLVVAVGASLVVFFSRAAGLSQSLQRRQAAVALADQTLELTRSVTATAKDAASSAVVRGRSAAKVQAQWSTAPADVAALLTSSQQVSDPTASATSVPVVPLSDTATVSGQPFTVEQYVGTCRRATTTDSASCTAGGDGVVVLRVVVAVSWSEGAGRTCGGSACRFVAASLLDASAPPQFMVNGGSIGGQVGVAKPDAATVRASSATQPSTTQINVKSNDTGTLDPDEPVSGLTRASGFRGTVALGGTSVGAVLYTAPTAQQIPKGGGWSTSSPYVETFQYTLTDSLGRTSTATVRVEVVP